MATAHHADGAGGWVTTIAGWGMSAWGWLTADMPGITIVLTILTIGLTAVNLLNAIKAYRGDTTPGKSKARRVRDAFRKTSPGGL